jgi:hypothetical protein
MPVGKGTKSIKLTGLKEVQNGIAENATEMKLALARSIFEAANEVATKSFHLVPIETGNLRSSQDIIRQKSLNQTQVRAEITYGGPAVQYALVQHERLDYNHPGGGQAKYLEQPFLEEVSDWPTGLANRIRMNFNYIKGGGS